MLDPVKEALWFYAAADYLTINAFLWKNTEAMEHCLKIVQGNNLGMIKEAEEQTPEKRFSFSGLDCKALFASYRRRTPCDLSPASKRGMLEQAIADIRLLCRSASPAQQEMLLFPVRHMCKMQSQLFSAQQVPYSSQLQWFSLHLPH